MTDHSEHYQPRIWLNGEIVDSSAARVPLSDLGLWGLGVTEMLRTFAGKPFLAEAHVERMFLSAHATGIACPAKDELLAAVETVLQENEPLLREGSEIGLSMCVTAGQNPLMTAADEHGRGTVAIVPFALPLEKFRQTRANGQRLVTSKVRPIPPDSIDPELKTRSRLHWRLAERDVQKTDAEARPLLIDRDGFIAETSTANILAVKDGAIWSPAPGNSLQGITRAFVLTAATEMEIPVQIDSFTVRQFCEADEVFLTSSLLGLCPVSQIDGVPIQQQRGRVFQRLSEFWGGFVGVPNAEFIEKREQVD